MDSNTTVSYDTPISMKDRLLEEIRKLIEELRKCITNHNERNAFSVYAQALSEAIYSQEVTRALLDKIDNKISEMDKYVNYCNSVVSEVGDELKDFVTDETQLYFFQEEQDGKALFRCVLSNVDLGELLMDNTLSDEEKENILNEKTLDIAVSRYGDNQRVYQKPLSMSDTYSFALSKPLTLDDLPYGKENLTNYIEEELALQINKSIKEVRNITTQLRDSREFIGSKKDNKVDRKEFSTEEIAKIKDEAKEELKEIEERVDGFSAITNNVSGEWAEKEDIERD